MLDPGHAFYALADQGPESRPPHPAQATFAEFPEVIGPSFFASLEAAQHVGLKGAFDLASVNQNHATLQARQRPSRLAEDDPAVFG